MPSRIYVAGAGYVGLATAVCYAARGNPVSIYEKDEAKRELIASGKTGFFEPALDELLADMIKAGRIEVVTSPERAVAESEFCFVAVGTPARKNGSVDLSAVIEACSDVGIGLKRCPEYNVLAIRSTVFPGTTSTVIRQTVERISGKMANREFGLVAYPEFLREGSAIHDMFHPDRVVIGGLDSRAGDETEALVRSFYQEAPPPIVRVSTSAAEMIKYASNALLATKVAFINEIANLCEQFDDVDVRQIADGMGFDHRIGREFLNAGLGFGGSCFPKDLAALVAGAKQRKVRLRIAEATLTSNKSQPLRVVALARRLIGELRGKRAAVLGLAFKAGTDDMRGAPSVLVVNALLKSGMSVSVYDPAAMRNAAQYLKGRVKYAENVRECLQGADCCFVITEWDEFRELQPKLLVETMRRCVVIDGRRVLDSLKLDPRITYRGIGLGK